MNNASKELNLNLVALNTVYLNTLGLFSKNFKSVSEIPQNATVTIANDVINNDRGLRLLATRLLPIHQRSLISRFFLSKGPSLKWIHKLYHTWLHDYDWSAAATKINSWSHFTTTIEGLRIHFVHERAKRTSKGVIPLLLVHGCKSPNIL